MNVSELNTILSQAPDVITRMNYYFDEIQNHLHPPFQELVIEYQSGTLVLENNPTLATIREHLDATFQQRVADSPPIGVIIDQLTDASLTLAVEIGNTQLTVPLQTVETLYNDALDVYNQSLQFEQEQLAIKQDSQQFTSSELGTPSHNFSIEFDFELKRDGIIVEFLRDILRVYLDRLNAVRIKIVMVKNASIPPPPPSDVNAVVTLLEQAQAISNRATTVNAAMQEAKSGLLTIGNGLLRHEIDLSNNELHNIQTSLNNLIATAANESITHDNIINQLNASRVGFWPERTNPALSTARTLAGARRSEAVAHHESAHLFKVFFGKVDKIVWQLDELPASPTERDFYSSFRNAVDSFHLVATYIETSYGKFALCSQQWWDIINLFLNDQRIKVQSRNDSLPFALLPVRLETRFMTIKHVKDNVTYSSFNEVFRTDGDMSDIKAARRENALRFTAGPMEGAPLLGVSSGQQIPDKHELWVRIYPDDISIHKHEEPLTQKELNDALTYWIENWKAVNNSALELGAWRRLCATCSPQRAAWIVSQTVPTNTTPDKPNTGTPPLASLNILPLMPPLTLRSSSWSEQPHTKVMPERFVVRVYSNGIPREYVGQLVPTTLPVGIDPANLYSNYLNQYGSEINMPPELRWLTNFEEAEKVGMGIRIPLQGNEKTDGFERLLVLGLKMDWDSTQSAQQLEKLFDNHHYSTGLALVPQGTPTNNTENKQSGYASIQPGFEESFAVELGAPLFSNSTTHYGKQDGQRLAEALGVNPSTFHHIANSNTYDIQESMTMSRAIWSSTLGYYVKNMLTPSLALNYIPPTKAFFTNYVLGRGLIPAFRVKNQPYGVLTSTVFSRWKYNVQFSFEEKLQLNFLEKLRSHWLLNFTIPLKLKRVTKADTDPSGTMVNVLGLHPSSVEFHQRMSTGSIMASNMQAFLSAAVAANSISNPASASSIIAALSQYLSIPQTIKSLYSGPSMQSFSITGDPRIFSLLFKKQQRLLTGPVIDSLPLSEIRSVENLQNCSANYLQWLATSSITDIRSENFNNVKNAPNLPTAVPNALLYLLLRQAWQLEYLDAAHCLLTSANVISVDAWHNHELLNMTNDMSPEGATAEQKQMLKGFVTAEVEYENEMEIEDIMVNLATNHEFQTSGMTPKQYHAYLRDQSRTTVEDLAASRYEDRLAEYHVAQSQWGYLTEVFPELASVPVHDHIRALLNSGNPCISDLKEVHDAFLKLQTLPTARLERCLAETLDTCAFRLDSWWNGLVSKRLLEQRQANPGGIYLGSYGILETVKPGGYPGIYVHNISTGTSWPSSISSMGARKMLARTPNGEYPQYDFGTFVVTPTASVQPASFVYIGDDPNTRLIEDPYSGKIVPAERENPENLGFILAPSLSHAVAAAVMRAGYAAHKKAGNATDAMAVGLSSSRVRTALYYLEGVRNGQNLGALLGYRFERGLHERQSGITSLDFYIQLIRQKYPVLSGSAARNVTDGLKLLQAYAKNGPAQPVWWPTVPITNPVTPQISTTATNPASYTTQGDAIEEEILKIKDDLDAIGDLLLSESVFQVTRGNHTRAGSVLQALGYGGTVPEPEIVNTPRQANTFTHRCAVRFNQSASSWTDASSIRAATEPNLNNWLASQLPAETEIVINYSYPGSLSNLFADMQDLNMQPIDLVYIFYSSTDTPTSNTTELSRRVVKYARTNHGLSDSVPITISYSERGNNFLTDDQRTIFELTPILQSLARVVSSSRILGPDDFMTPAEVQTLVPPVGEFDSSPLYTRISAAKQIFDNIIFELTAQTLGQNPPVTARDKVSGVQYNGNNPPVPSNASTLLDDLRSVLIDACSFNVATAFPESHNDSNADVQKQLVSQADATYKEMNKRAIEVNLLWSQIPVLPSPANSLTPSIEKDRVSKLVEIAKLLFGKSFKVFAKFTLHDLSQVQAAFSYNTLLTNAGPLPVETFMSGISRVRPKMREYYKQVVLSDAVRNLATAVVPFNFTSQKVMQFPVMDAINGTDRWLGARLLPTDVIPKDAVSLILETDGTAFSSAKECGMVIDEWPEQIPIDKIDAGVSINYDQPNSDAPQSILLAVTPQEKGYWTWDDLMDTLNETIDMAKIRSVDPDIIHQSAFGQVLPMLIAQVSGDGTNDSPSLDFARNMVVVPPGFNSPIVYTPPPMQ